jgi:hypothetical protein
VVEIVAKIPSSGFDFGAAFVVLLDFFTTGF